MCSLTLTTSVYYMVPDHHPSFLPVSGTLQHHGFFSPEEQILGFPGSELRIHEQLVGWSQHPQLLT